MPLRYLIRKCIYGLSVLWGVVTLVFFLFNVLPDDPARLTLGQRSDLASIENVRKDLRLDQPLGKRYLYYLLDLSPVAWSGHEELSQERYQGAHQIVMGNGALLLKKPYLGRSYQSKRPVWDVLSDAFPGTVILALSAMAIAVVLGMALGVLAALNKGTWWDTTAILASITGISAPSFFAGLIIAYLFGFVWHDYTHLDMVGSLWIYDINGERRLAPQNLILPALTLGIRPMAIIAQLTRSSLLDVLSQDYVRTAYAKGLGKAKVIWRHALPNALNPVITAISGWLAELLAGSFFIEFIFSWKGIGKLTVDSLDKFDFPVVMGALLLTASVFILINTLTDLLYTKIDPRVKLS